MEGGRKRGKNVGGRDVKRDKGRKKEVMGRGRGRGLTWGGMEERRDRGKDRRNEGSRARRD